MDKIGGRHVKKKIRCMWIPMQRRRNKKYEM
jgi:hypothetical protein